MYVWYQLYLLIFYCLISTRKSLLFLVCGPEFEDLQKYLNSKSSNFSRKLDESWIEDKWRDRVIIIFKDGQYNKSLKILDSPEMIVIN